LWGAKCRLETSSFCRFFIDDRIRLASSKAESSALLDATNASLMLGTCDHWSNDSKLMCGDITKPAVCTLGNVWLATVMKGSSFSCILPTSKRTSKRTALKCFPFVSKFRGSEGRNATSLIIELSCVWKTDNRRFDKRNVR